MVSSGDHDPRFSLAKCKAVYAKMLPSIKRHARIAFRYLNPEEKQERVQNVLANTWEALVRLARRGKLDQAFPSVLAKFAEKQTRDHRITGGHMNIKEILSKYCQLNKDVVVERLDRFNEEDGCWEEAVVQDTRNPFHRAIVQARRTAFPVAPALPAPARQGCLELAQQMVGIRAEHSQTFRSARDRARHGRRGLDVWFRQEVQPRLRGSAHLIRYADDFVILFRHEDDARRVMEVLPKRFGKYGLTLHPDKTRLIPFHCPPRKAIGGTEDGDHQPSTFDLLGFTHYWGRTRRGGWAVMRQTVSKRLSRAVRSIAEWCQTNRHRPVCEQHAILSQKVRGHYAYYGITGNSQALRCFLLAVHRAWRKWLDRRNRQREMTWDRFNRLLKRYPLPPPRIVHSYVK